MRTRTLTILTLCGFFCFLGWGCSKSGWSKSQIEAKVKEAAHLTELQLTEKEKGKYEGTGKSGQGKTYNVTATYSYSSSENKSELKWEADDSQGDRKSGSVTEQGAKK